MAFDSYSFNPGLSSLVYLPINGNRNIFTPTLKAGLSGGKKELDPCYGQYGILWKWSTFESSSSAFQVLTSTRTTCPSSWATMQCAFSAGSTSGDLSGPYPKKWILGTKAPSASFFNPILFSCSATPVIWTLSCNNWFEQRTIPLSVSNSFDFELRLFDYGLLPYTTSVYNDTAFTLNATLTVGCLDTENLSSAQTLISETVNFTAVAPPLIKIYTPNRFVLTATHINYQNLITNISTITALNIDLDDGKTFYLTGSDLTKNYFNATYDVLGFKTLKVTAYSNYNGETIFTETFNDILQVLDKYDEISPEEYRIATEFVNLPWKIQPCVGSNDWAIEDNINNCFKQFHENLEYLDSRSKVYNNTYSDYFGYLGAVPTTLGSLTSIPAWTWEDADCFNTTLDYSITWRKLLSAETAVDMGEFANFGTWEDQECRSAIGSINCTERGSLTGSECIDWNWKSRKSNTGKDLITWTDTTSASKYAKRWRFEICPAEFFIICNTGTWNVNIPGVDRFYPEFAVPSPQIRCLYYGLASKENNLYLAQKTEIKILSSDRDAMYYSSRSSFDDVLDFSSLECIRLDSNNKIFVLDSVLSQVASYNFSNRDWKLFANWGGVGSGNFRFLNPQDIHIDQLDNVWVADTGNFSIKHYSNTGTWLKTIQDESLNQNNAPISLCVDSEKQLHVLTTKEIRVYSYNGDFIFSYSYSDYVSENTPRRINTSYNREIIYFALDKQVLKFFRNGVFAGYIIQERNNVYNIKDIFHDEYRNLLIATNDKILKFPDLMTQINSRGKSNFAQWDLNDLYIHKEEYVQNWVYNKSFQRLWDNIENFRNTLFFTQQGCKSYKGPVYGKDQIILGQNEIVTSTVINRILNYLWVNFNTLIDYFDPNCIDQA